MSNLKRFSFALGACFAGFLLAEFSGISQAKADPPTCPLDANDFSVGFECWQSPVTFCFRVSGENGGNCGDIVKSSCSVVNGACVMGSECRILCPGL